MGQTKQDDAVVLGREYTASDLRAIWDFTQHDFEGFLDCLAWLETLSHGHRREQLESAKSVRSACQPIPPSEAEPVIQAKEAK